MIFKNIQWKSSIIFWILFKNVVNRFVCVHRERERERRVFVRSVYNRIVYWKVVVLLSWERAHKKREKKNERKSHEITYELIFSSMKMDRNKLLRFIVDKKEWNLCINGLPYLEMYVLYVGWAWKRRWCWVSKSTTKSNDVNVPFFFQ